MSQLHPFEADSPAPAADHRGGEAHPASLSTYFHLVGQVEDQVRFADSKAAFLATIHTLLVGPLVYNLAALRTAIHEWDDASRAVLVGLGGLYVLTFVLSMGLVAMTVLPRFRRRGRPASRLFFGRIAREFGDDPDRFVAQIGALTEREWVEELGVYVVDASRIAASKHRYVRQSTVLTVASVVVWCLVVMALLALK